MIVEIGQYALVLALALAIVQGLAPLVGALRHDAPLMAMAQPAAVMQFLLIALSFTALTYAYVTSDFSVVNVFENSHSLKPLLYKFSGVWGNHDFGLCVDQSDEIRKQYSSDILEFMSSLQPRLEIEGCLFTHIEPWLDPNNVYDLWYFDGLPETQEKLNRSFAAMPHRVMFIGHYHSWLVGSTAGIVPWNGETPIKLNATQQHLVVVNAVCHGYCALFDTTSNELIPFNDGSDVRLT